MTRPLRRLHLLAWLVLGPLAIAVLAAALVSRPARPVQPALEPAERAP